MRSRPPIAPAAPSPPRRRCRRRSGRGRPSLPHPTARPAQWPDRDLDALLHRARDLRAVRLPLLRAARARPRRTPHALPAAAADAGRTRAADRAGADAPDLQRRRARHPDPPAAGRPRPAQPLAARPDAGGRARAAHRPGGQFDLRPARRSARRAPRAALRVPDRRDPDHRRLRRARPRATAATSCWSSTTRATASPAPIPETIVAERYIAQRTIYALAALKLGARRGRGRASVPGGAGGACDGAFHGRRRSLPWRRSWRARGEGGRQRTGDFRRDETPRPPGLRRLPRPGRALLLPARALTS